jgi:transcription antitermination factor NusA-like protein
LSLAIGKKGQNVRLAAKLTGWKIDIKSEEEKRREIEAILGEMEGPKEEDVEGTEQAGAAEPVEPEPAGPMDRAAAEPVAEAELDNGTSEQPQPVEAAVAEDDKQ